jgi:ABC-type transporter Mla MlaB component
MTLRIDKSLDGEFTILRLAGELRSSELPELRPFIEGAGANLRLDLQELSMVDAGAVQFLGACESSGIELVHCPAYIREWMSREAERAKDSGERREL